METVRALSPTSITQEFQWSRSLFMVLVQYSPTYVSRLPARMKFQFLFSQLWYPLFAFFMAMMFALPIIALLSGQSFVNVTYPQFLLHFAPLSAVLLLLAYRWRAGGSYRPFNARVLSWEYVFFQFARWPWALAGTVAALRDWLTGSTVEFRITPKGSSQVDPLPVRVLAPYAILSIGSALPVVLIDNSGEARGFYVFALINTVLYAVLLLIIVVQHARENVVRVTSRTYWPALAVTFASILVLAGVGTVRNGMSGAESLAWGAGRLSLFSETYSIAGAGFGEAGMRRIRFQPRWRQQAPVPTDTNQKEGRTERTQQ